MTPPQFYKLVRKGWIHHGIKLNLGLNTLTERYVDSFDIPSGGFYICSKEDIPYWLDLYSDLQCVCEVTLPYGTSICVGERKIKVNRMILSNPVVISRFLELSFTKEELVNCSLELNAMIHHITRYDILKEILMKNINLFIHVQSVHRVPKLCWMAIEANPAYLAYVPYDNQSKELCLKAVSMDPKVVYAIICPALRSEIGRTINPWWNVTQERINLGLEWGR